MRQVIIATVFLIAFISCNDNKNAGRGNNADSTSVNSSDSSSSGAGSSANGTGATGTTGTGTVSDSGNAAHPGSDTSGMKMKSPGNK